MKNLYISTMIETMLEGIVDLKMDIQLHYLMILQTVMNILYQCDKRYKSLNSYLSRILELQS
jgi:hypothetical protein